MPLKPSIGIVLLLVFNSSISFAQTFIGGSVNVGNQVVAEPFSEGIKRPFMLSGNVAIANVNRIYRNTYINYGAGLGLLAYNFSVKLQDTLSEGTRYSTREVSTLYLRTNLSIWQKVNIDSKPHFIGIGGGVTLQHTFFSRTGFTFETTQDNQNYTVLEAALFSTPKPLGFLRASIFKPVGSNLMFGFEYTHHFSPIITGWYEFSHTRSPSYGNLSIYQREVSLTALVRISKREILR